MSSDLRARIVEAGMTPRYEYGDERAYLAAAVEALRAVRERMQAQSYVAYSTPEGVIDQALAELASGDERPQPSAPVAVEQGNEQLGAKDRLIAVFRKYAALEESVEEFECPHDAEARCDCGSRQDRLYRQARQLRKELLAITEGLSPPLVIDRREVAEDSAPLLPADPSASVTTETLPK